MQATSRATRLRSEKFDKNVTKRGNVPVGKAAVRPQSKSLAKSSESCLLLHLFHNLRVKASAIMIRITTTEVLIFVGSFRPIFDSNDVFCFPFLLLFP
jgi:hypothetical protein